MLEDKRPAPEATGAGSHSLEDQADPAPALQTELDSIFDLPPLRAFLSCAGVKIRPISFYKAVDRETVDGYPRTSATITVKRDGDIALSGDLDPPSEAMAASVKAAVLDAAKAGRLPAHITLTSIAELPPGVTSLRDPDVFVCHDHDGRITMVLQRVQLDGKKLFKSWTQWSDGKWRNAEPDTMPFFGLPGHEQHSTLFLHEGAKAARRVREIIAGDRQDRLPWLEQLRHGHHVGWLGGVFAVERSDWPRLAALGWKKVVIVADNDAKGLRAAREIAPFFACPTYIVAFDKQFENGFDLGDDWPAELFDDAGEYRGPSYMDCLRPATKCTWIQQSGDRGRPLVGIRREFAEQVAYTIDPPRFVFRDIPDRDLSAEEFNARVAPFSDLKDTATKLLTAAECQHDKLIYLPGHQSGTIIHGGQRCFNVFAAPHFAVTRGDCGPWLTFLEHLFPDEGERSHVIRWLATLIAMPKVRMMFGLLFISTTQGVGKTTVGTVLKRVLGERNVSFPNQKEVVESAFNGWLARKRLAFVSELYSGHSRKAYDELKDKITDPDVTVNEKHTKQYRLDNFCHIIACSNSEAALHLDDEDRRWFVPTIAEACKRREWWAEFYHWLDGPGAGLIYGWASEHVRAGHFVRPGETAPPSRRKKMIAEGSRSEGQQLAFGLAEHLVGHPSPVIVRISDVRRWIAVNRGFLQGSEPNVSDRRLEKPGTIIAAMKKVAGITVWADNLRPKFGATREAVIMNFAPGPDDTWQDIKSKLTSLEEIGAHEPS